MQDAARQKSPDFDRPPLTEVVCGVQFAPIEGWLTSHYGLFWNRIKAAYPGSEDQPPLRRLKLEEFQTPDEFNLALLPPLRRVFFTTAPANYLVQLQNNRFLHNWRKLNESDGYPRFPEAYSRFSERWSDFNSFLADCGLPASLPQVYELTYVNMISAPEAVFPRDVWRFMNFYKELPRTASGSGARGLELRLSWPLEDDAGTLNMKLNHGVMEPVKGTGPVLVVEFTALGRAGKGRDDMELWFKTAHDAIVHTFVALTTPESHEMWGKTT
jgi:uncharacterized protein (TIGR04255 family)